MDNEALIRQSEQLHWERQRTIFFKDVKQAYTTQGLEQAFNYYVRLEHRELAPGLTFVCSRFFLTVHGSQHFAIAQMITRFHNCVIEKAFSMPVVGTEISDALKVVATDGYDRSYIIRGHRDSMLEEGEFKTKINEMADI